MIPIIYSKFAKFLAQLTEPPFILLWFYLKGSTWAGLQGKDVSCEVWVGMLLMQVFLSYLLWNTTVPTKQEAQLSHILWNFYCSFIVESIPVKALALYLNLIVNFLPHYTELIQSPKALIRCLVLLVKISYRETFSSTRFSTAPRVTS